jgi:general secretion pathway protein G
MNRQETGYGIQDAGSGRTSPVSCIPYPASSRGFTLLELILVISIIAVLAGVFLARVPFYQEQAEKAAMEQVAGAVQSALLLRFAALQTRGAATDKNLKVLATDNPLDWLQQKPKNYAGEFFDPSPRSITPGQWLFDLKSRDLIYLPQHRDYLNPGKDGQLWLRFHVRLGYETAVGGKGKELTTTVFEPVEAYRWLD